MADELNTPNHRYHQRQYNVALAPNEVSKQFIYASGVAKIDAKIVSPLFAASEQGVWFDPSDLTTLFQDNAGTTPVTAPGQTVGLMLDKSQGVPQFGPELVTNGTFVSGTTGWTGSGATLSVVSGALRITATAASPFAVTSFTTVIGKTYLMSAQFVTDAMTGNAFIYVGSSFAAADLAFINAGSTLGTYAASFIATTTTTYIVLSGNTFALPTEYMDWDNVSCKLTSGYPAIQNILAQRPTYGINPITGTRNLLTYTEQFDNAVWFKSNATVTNNSSTAPDGTTTADTIDFANGTTGVVLQSITPLPSISYSCSFYIKGTAGQTLTPYSETTGGTYTFYTPGTVTLTGNWQRVSWVHTTSVGNTLLYPVIRSQSADTAKTIYLWGVQLEVGSTATAYQKVVSQYEVTEAGVQSVSYLAFDGVDDGMVTNTITPGTDKVQVFAGVRKLSNAVAYGTIVEMSAGSGTGRWALFAPSAAPPLDIFDTLGTLYVGNYASTAAPSTNVMTGIADIGSPFASISINSVVISSSTATQGTGNYSPNIIYIGRRGGTTFPFNGRLYSLLTRFGANLTIGQIASTESWVNAKTGAY